MRYGRARWIFSKYLTQEPAETSQTNRVFPPSGNGSDTSDTPSDHPSSGTPRLDLALEAHEAALGALGGPAVPGVTVTTDTSDPDIVVSTVVVETEEGASRIGKQVGTYISVEAPKLRHRDSDLQQRVIHQVQQGVSRLMEGKDFTSVLVIGLGNAQVTPDALGPLVTERMFVTRHLLNLVPNLEEEGYRELAAVAPGVLGVTGIETQEVVLGIVEHVKPKLVIAIDSLASTSLSRVNSTIQIADSGIHPGSGVGNHRKGLTKETLGVPVIGIGVPTVVDAATIASEAIEAVVRELESQLPGNAASAVLGGLQPREKWQMIAELLEPVGNNLMVTPKEIDEFVEDAANIIAKGLNLAVHPGMTLEEANLLSY